MSIEFLFKDKFLFKGSHSRLLFVLLRPSKRHKRKKHYFYSNEKRKNTIRNGRINQVWIALFYDLLYNH